MPKKIFELAKELNKGPLDLVEELKQFGLAVRNHMASLTDEEVARVMEKYRPTPAASAPTAKKVVTKKKAVKKEEGEKVATSTPGKNFEKTPVVDASTAHSEDDKKKTVIRRKSSKDEKLGEISRQDDTAEFSIPIDENSASTPLVNTPDEEESASVLSTESSDVAPETMDSTENTPVEEVVSKKASEEDVQPERLKTDEKSARPSGLRVVSRPPVTQPKTELIKAEAIQAANNKTEKKDEKQYYQEKVHRFTPVFIPEKVEKKETTSARPKQEKTDKDRPSTSKPAAAGHAGAAGPIPPDAVTGEVVDGDRDDLGSVSGKRRLGGLASMMSGKKLTVSRSQLLIETKAEDELKNYSALSSLGRPIYTQVKKKKVYSGPSQQTLITELKDSKRVISVHKVCQAQELAQKLNIKFQDMSDRVLDMNLLMYPFDYVGMKLATEIAALYNYRVEDSSFNEEKAIGKKAVGEEERSKFPLRDPVVTIMGHVDHGKTTLLDYIRKSKVAAGEAGGITQHIGAYSVKTKTRQLTFLDTPGHAAFANMRQRGANVTDIIVLVVAADDGVMPQTKESVRFAQNAKVPIIVAVNKIDKEGANADRVKTGLMEMGLTPEEWGGETVFAPISGLKGTGVDELLEAIALQAEIMDLRADNKGAAEGIVIESKIEQGRGPVATVLVQKGTLNKGDSIVVGETFGRARSLTTYTGEQLEAAGPSVPVQILGLESVPGPGDVLNVVKNEREAKKIVDNRIEERKKQESAPEKKKMSLEDFFSGLSQNNEEERVLNLIIRSDVQGSFEAIKNSVEALTTPEVAVKVLGGGVGAITDSDVQLAISSKAYVIGFNMRPVTSARRLAEEKGVDIKNYSIIYDLINEVKLAIEGLLEPEYSEEFLGRAEVREVFVIPKIGAIAGSNVVDGKIANNCKIRLIRNGKIVHDGKLSSLKRFKDDVKEVKNGQDCGIALENYNDIKVGDLFEAYILVEKRRKYDDMAKQSGQTPEARA